MTTRQAALNRVDRAFDRIEPMLPLTSAEPSDSLDRLYEIKWEGLRAISTLGAGSVEMYSRSGSELAPAFPEVALALQDAVGSVNVVLDGELVALGDDGVPQRHAVVERWLTGNAVQVNYEVFDILELNGESLLDLPLYERKGLLHDTVNPNSIVHVCHFEEGGGIAMYDAANELGLHGVVAKDKFSRYEPGKRSEHWLATKHSRSMNLIVGGYTFGGSEQPFGSLLLGAFDGDRLRYMGSVGGGFAKGDPALVYRAVAGLHAGECPFTQEPALDRFSYWCEPSLVVEVEYGERSPQGTIRFLVFSSLRPDVKAGEIEFDRLVEA